MTIRGVDYVSSLKTDRLLTSGATRFTPSTSQAGTFRMRSKVLATAHTLKPKSRVSGRSNSVVHDRQNESGPRHL